MAGGNGYDLEAMRAALPLLNEVTYLNTGTVGIMAEPVIERHLAAQADYERGGHLAQARAQEGYEHARAALAALLNVDPAELALTRNATDGVSLVAAGLSLTPDDQVLTTNEEHPAVIVPWSSAERRGGARLGVFPISSDAEETLAALERALTPATRLVIVSHVSCETGVRLPIEEICRRCRERGILTMIDAAQSLAQFPVDARAIGCDFMSGNGHKWLCGPKGTGFLYLRQELIGHIIPILVGDGTPAPRFNRVVWGSHPADADWDYEPTAKRFEYGTRNWHTFAALPDAVDYLTGFGWDRIWGHVAEISTQLKQRLAELPGATVHTPMSWDESCGIVTFSYRGWDGVELASALWHEHGIIQRRVQVPSAVRISCAYFTSEEDIDRLLGTLVQLGRA